MAIACHRVDGDAFALKKYRKILPNTPYCLKRQLVEAARVCNPNAATSAGYLSQLNVEDVNPKNGNRIVNGVEIDEDGAVVAFWIADRILNDDTRVAKAVSGSRVEAFGAESGVANVLQIYHEARREQYTGVALMAPFLEESIQVSS